MVGQDLRCLYDALVVPPNPILDYKTQYSGITEETLRGVDTSLEDVQKHLMETLIRPDTVLVGHSLENDLSRLRIAHRHVIDTAILYPYTGTPTMSQRSRQYKGRRSLKHKLSHLADRYLNETIQVGEHDSTVDAVTCMQLMKRWLVYGRAKSQFSHAPLAGDSSPHRPPPRSRSICERISRAGATCYAIDRQPILTECFANDCRGFAAETDDEAAANCCNVLEGLPPVLDGGVAPFVWCQLHQLSDVEPETFDGSTKTDVPEGSLSPHRQAQLRQVDKRISTIHGRLPVGSVLVCVSGGSELLASPGRGSKGFAFFAAKHE